jgi:predicted O-methyltransferase YrrM
MPNITYEPVERYLYSMLPERHPVLREIEEQAKQRDIPIVGPAVGGLFHLLAQITGAKRVFELGSAVGYSTIWWALAMGEGCKVVYTDSDPKNADEARGYFARAGVADRIEVHVGDALARLAQEPRESWDIVFNDVDKKWYPDVLPLAVERVKRGGLFITDNVLWSGRVTDPFTKEESTRAIQRFNYALLESKEMFTSILPLRDGVAVARKR